MSRPVVLFILAACSGTGKSTLARRLLEAHPRLRLSVSHTTRAPRPGEVDGVHYHFIDRARFEALRADGIFAEWAEYAGNLYGTARTELDRAATDGFDLLFDIEVVGAGNLKRAWPEAVMVFILPPAWPVIEARLRGRGTNTEDEIQRRMAAARRELVAARDFDYLVLNDALDAAEAELTCIYAAARMRVEERRALLDALVPPD